MPSIRGAVALVVAGLMIMLSLYALTANAPTLSVGATASEPMENPVVVTKDKGAPRASAEARSFVSPDYGRWFSWIENSGLRSLVVDVYDNTTGAPEEVMHLRVRFAAYDAYPSGRVDLPVLIMPKNRLYEFVLIPNGPVGGQGSYFHELVYTPPVVTFTYEVLDLLVMVDASASTDPDGTVVSWDWDWGDGSPHGSGVMAQHVYENSGIYTITLVITDNDGLTTEMSQDVTVTAPSTEREVVWTISNMFELREKEMGWFDDPNKLGHWGDEMGVNSYLLLRESWYDKHILRDSYPFMQVWSPYSRLTVPDSHAGFLVTSWYRMYTDARNIEELGTGPGKDPIFLPILGDRNLDGGNVDIRWYSTYLTSDELTQIRQGTHYANSYYGVPYGVTPSSAADDGFWNELHGRMWLDRNASVKFLNLPGLGDLRTEFEAERLNINTLWMDDWIAEGSHGGQYDIYTAYDYPLDNRGVWVTLDPESTVDALVLRFWTISWGNEILLQRYTEGATVSPNWNGWPDDWYLNITMRNGSGDLRSRAVMGYSLTAWKDLESFSGAWMLESNDLDWCGNTAYHNSYMSKYNDYDPDQTDASRHSWSPGTVNYGNRVSYWSAPTELDLAAGERLVIKLPSNETSVIGITPYRGTSDVLDDNKKAELTGNMYWGELVMGNGWPNGTVESDLKGFYNETAKTVDIRGPVDFPRYPNPIYPDLMETGAPTFLFDVSEASYYDITVEGDEPILPDEVRTVTVTARNMTGAVVTDWNSTMGFSVVFYPADGNVIILMYTEHTFDPSEVGMYQQTVTFHAGIWVIMAQDLVYDPDVCGRIELEVVAPP